MHDRLYRYVLTSWLVFCCCGFLTTAASADVMNNGNFNLDTGDVNVQSILHRNPSDQAERTTQIPVKKNYQIENDFANSSLSLSIPQQLINYGTLSSADPVLRTSLLKISNRIGGYQIIADEDRSLQKKNGTIVPDTSCDNGSCSETTAAEWSNTLTYGLGYRCDNVSGSDCPDDFTQPDYYRAFSNLMAQQSGQAVMQSAVPVTRAISQITYKVSISGTQPSGNYTNTITYIAVPGF